MPVIFESGITSVEGRYTDIDAYIEVCRHGDLDICQLSQGVNEAVIFQCAAEGFRFASAAHSKTTEHHAYNASPGLTFALPETTIDSINFLGKLHTTDTLVVIPENAEFFAIGPDNTAMYSVSLSFELIESVCRRWLPRGATLSYPSSTALYTLHSDQAAALRQALRRLRALLGSCNCSCQTLAVTEHLEWFVIPSLIAVLTDYRPAILSRGKFGTHDSLEGVLSLIHENLDAPPRISELADRCGISSRTIQLLFSRHIGLTPKAYINVKRLNGARKHLRASARKNGRVSDAANAMGFWHMGQFARDFKQLFGYHPSHSCDLFEP